MCEIILDGVGDEVNPEDQNGRTPLYDAIKNGHDEISCMILDKIKDINPKDKKGSTPLHEAAKWGHSNIFKLIMDMVEDKHPRGIYDKLLL